MRLEALMKALGYKQVGFASMIGVGPTVLNNYLKALRRPDLDIAINIQAKTGITLDWLYLGDRSGLPAKLLEILPDLSARSQKAG